MGNIREQLETAISGLKCVRAYYEEELPVYTYIPTSRLPHPGDMLNHVHRAIDPLHRALAGVVHEEKKAAKSTP